MTCGRLNIPLSSHQRKRLCAMAKELGCTKAEVLRRALALLKTALDANREGCALSVVQGGVVVKELVVV